ncbi:hypothetical protein OWM54_15685 [Myxococcus sp. MISCRS1]|uniref:hypothetical protein n=1 Tax=Myxococcus sp. MISCRS1 TaxID=2996786 RepID=UPI00226D5177|nr:hypothetical protein [Myxococcus sp. MISCRS1]MCY0998579.1 hypothetical protein [Myxococcus sp. MISCRS1]
MSIAIQNRSPLPRTSCLEPTSSLPQSTPTPRAGNDLQRKLQTDSFEQGDLAKLQAQLSQLLGGLTQQLQSLGVQAPASLGGEAPPAPASISAQKPSAPSLAAKTAEAPRTHPTSDAGPGFGAPSAGSTVPAPVDQPWLAKNNVGSPYNSNIQLIDPGQKDQFKYTNTFTNSTNQPQTITLWNKTGEHGGPNDGQHFDKSTPKTFTLQPGHPSSSPSTPTPASPGASPRTAPPTPAPTTDRPGARPPSATPPPAGAATTPAKSAPPATRERCPSPTRPPAPR